MPRFRAQDLKRLGCDLFTAVGVPTAEADLVSGHMVDSGLLGHDSHSVLRFPQYTDMVRKGQVKPGAELEILHDRGGVVQVSGGWNYGPVTATRAAELAIDRARSHAIVAVTVKDCNHVARLGRFVDLIARQGNLIGVLCANGHGSDLAVAPYGGRERRLPTNPLAVGIPTRRSWPIVLDMTTSMTSGGALRDYRKPRHRRPRGLHHRRARPVDDGRGGLLRRPAGGHASPGLSDGGPQGIRSGPGRRHPGGCAVGRRLQPGRSAGDGERPVPHGLRHRRLPRPGRVPRRGGRLHRLAQVLSAHGGLRGGHASGRELAPHLRGPAERGNGGGRHRLGPDRGPWPRSWV